jgi:hypothetical protein
MEVVGITVVGVGCVGKTTVELGETVEAFGVTSVGCAGKTAVEEGVTVEVVGVTMVFWSSRASTVVVAKTRV